jgi:hypothetical protein
LILLLAQFFSLLPALFSLCLPPAVPALADRILDPKRSLQSSTQSLTPYTSLSTLRNVCPLFLGRNAPLLCFLLTGSSLGLSTHNILQMQDHLTTYHLHHYLDCQLVILLRIVDLSAAHCAQFAWSVNSSYHNHLYAICGMFPVIILFTTCSLNYCSILALLGSIPFVLPGASLSTNSVYALECALKYVIHLLYRFCFL